MLRADGLIIIFETLGTKLNPKTSESQQQLQLVGQYHSLSFVIAVLL